MWLLLSHLRISAQRRGLLALCFAALWQAAPLVTLAQKPDLKQTRAKQAADIPARLIPRPTEQVILFLRPGADPRDLARRYGMQYAFSLVSDPNAHVFFTASEQVAQMTVPVARMDAAVRAAYLNRRTGYVRSAFVPNDPYFPNGSPTGWPGQWHLLNSIVPGRDAGVVGAWSRDITGSGVIVGIVDDGLQTTHPDLAPNYSAANSYDFGQGNADPSPVYSGDNHGTSVAGVAAARGGNSIGGTGAAPLASLAGLRVDFLNGTDQMFADATLYRSSGATAPIAVKNHSYGYSVPYIVDALAYDAVTTSADAGTIHVWAAGNGRNSNGEDSAKQYILIHPDVIGVAAFGSDGVFASYSSFGGNVFVTAPSSSFNSGAYDITTTDRTGSAGYNATTTDGDPFPALDYTGAFGGTSSASPLTAGIMALGKQAQPALDARFAKHLLAQTSRLVDAADASIESDGGWKTNDANFKFNQNYGFGLIDANAFTLLATEFTGVTPPAYEDTALASVGATIPDNNLTGIARTFAIATAKPLEMVQIYLNATHTWRGDLEAYLTSPRGTTSRLMFRGSGDSEDNLDWVFASNAFWGENPQGTWTLTLRDVFQQDQGTWNYFQARVYTGRLIAVPVISAISPAQASTGSAALTLTVTGSRFTPESVVTWNGAARATRFYSHTELRATILASDLAAAGTALVRVQTPDPGGTSASRSFAIGSIGTTVVVKSDAGTAFTGTIGQNVWLKGNVTRNSDRAGLANRALIFKVDGQQVGTATTISSGSAWLPYIIPNATTPGLHTVTVEFAGEPGYDPSSGQNTLTANANTRIRVISDSGGQFTGKAGQGVWLKGNVTRANDNAGLANRTLIFKVDGQQVGTATTISSGSAWFRYVIPANTPPATYTVTVEFAGEPYYNPGSGSGTLTVTP